MFRAAYVIVITLTLLFVCIDSASASGFIKAKGTNLVVGADEQIIHLSGINFNNFHWETEPYLILNSKHHREADFKRLKSMGMNVVRFNISYVVFESDEKPYEYKQEGWDWLDKNIGWAEKYGIYLIIDMHVPQGGYQGGTDDGYGLWDDKSNQKRLKALWKAIASRYKDKTIIAAWDILNEPTPRDSSNWQTLADELITEIRSVDTNHLIIVEADMLSNFLPVVSDTNIMYDIHFYSPNEYTHQYDYNNGQGNGGVWPDSSSPIFISEHITYDTVQNPTVPPGDSDWVLYEGNLYKVDNPVILSGMPSFSCGKNSGTVYFDDFYINEYDSEKNFIRRIDYIDIHHAPEGEEYALSGISPFLSVPGFWSFWSADDSGSYDKVYNGHFGHWSMYIQGVADSANLTNSNLSFPAKQGYYYSISGWMKGQGVTDDSCQMTLEFTKLSDGQSMKWRTADYLKSEIFRYIETANKNNRPFNVGEFGLIKWCFKDNKGGLNWVSDVVNILKRYGISFQYYDYHSNDFGVYNNDDELPGDSNGNTQLIELFKDLLKKPKPVIKANGICCSLTIKKGNNVSFSVSLNPGDFSMYDADWWFAKNTPFGWSSYDRVNAYWTDGLIPVHHGTLFGLNTATTTDTILDPKTSYYFGIDLSMNNQVDTDSLTYSDIEITVLD